MSFWSVRWAHLAERDLLWIPWREAERVAVAVRRFAETGEGVVRRVGTDTDELRLYVGSYYARITYDPAEHAIHVWRVRKRNG